MMRCRLTLVLMALFVVALAGCDRGPAPTALQADMQAALDAMEANLLRVVSLRPQGSAPGAAANETIAYANVVVELTRNHDFGAWGGINVGTLASTLGATAAGIRPDSHP